MLTTELLANIAKTIKVVLGFRLEEPERLC